MTTKLSPNPLRSVLNVGPKDGLGPSVADEFRLTIGYTVRDLIERQTVLVEPLEPVRSYGLSEWAQREVERRTVAVVEGLPSRRRR